MDNTTHDSNTLNKVLSSLTSIGWGENEVTDAVHAMQNAGILFREKDSESESFEVFDYNEGPLIFDPLVQILKRGSIKSLHREGDTLRIVFMDETATPVVVSNCPL